jgi:hypothetical protein
MEQRAQPVAIRGKCSGGESGADKQKALPWVATSCQSGRMVRVHSLQEHKGVAPRGPLDAPSEPEGPQDLTSRL